MDVSQQQEEISMWVILLKYYKGMNLLFFYVNFIVTHDFWILTTKSNNLRDEKIKGYFLLLVKIHDRCERTIVNDFSLRFQ